MSAVAKRPARPALATRIEARVPWAWHRYRYAALAYGLFVVLLALNVALSERFFCEAVLVPLIAGAAPLVILTIASTVPMVAGNGGIDISVGPLAGLVNVVLVVGLAGNSSPAVVLPVALGMGLASGAVIGFLVAYVRLAPIVVTLGAYLIYAALAQVIFADRGGTAPGGWPTWATGSAPSPAASSRSRSCSALARAEPDAVLPLPVRGRRRRGRRLHRRRARRARAGGAYVIAGLFAAIAGLAVTGLIAAADPEIGPSLTLTAIAGAALGGTSLAGGRGGVLGALAGGLRLSGPERAVAHGGGQLLGDLQLRRDPRARHRAQRDGHGRRQAAGDRMSLRLSATGLGRRSSRGCASPLLFAAGALIDGFYTGRRSARSSRCARSWASPRRARRSVVMGGIDLSIPALMTLTRRDHRAQRAGLAISVLVLIAVVCVGVGALNGLLSTLFNVHPLIITLGVGFMVGGLLLAWTQGKPEGSLPDFISEAAAAASTMGPIPLPPIVAVWAGVAVVTIVMARRTPFGRRIFAYGSSPRAAGYALVRPRRLWMGVFAFSGLTAFVAGVMLAGFTGYGDLRAGDPYLFNTVAAVILGGTSLLGGRGGYGRTIAGTLMLTLAQLILVGQGVERRCSRWRSA